MKKKQMDILYKYINSEKSIFSTMVLRLMETEMFSNNYCESLELVCELFPEINIVELEKELDKYI
jgi:hypothetical protein